jgi:hypothetical protein
VRFEPAGGDWPEVAPDQTTSVEALAEAVEQARSYFSSRHDEAALKRLPRARAITETRNWVRLGDEQDTWVIPSQGEVPEWFNDLVSTHNPQVLDEFAPGDESF